MYTAGWRYAYPAYRVDTKKAPYGAF